MPHRTADSYLILMFDGSTVEDVERRCDAAAQICLDNGAEDVFLCNTDERKEAVWTVRGASLEALKASTTDMMNAISLSRETVLQISPNLPEPR